MLVFKYQNTDLMYQKNYNNYRLSFMHGFYVVIGTLGK